MSKTSEKRSARLRRQRSIRKRVQGTSSRPRLSVFRSSRHIYAQVIDDATGRTLVSASTQSKDAREEVSGKKKVEQAKLVGKLVAERCLAQQIERVAFDRNGFIYHGRVAAVAEGAREAGLNF